MEKNQNKFVYDIQFHDGHRMKLSEIFRILEGMKEDLNIESYALSGTTLEQVFIKMANQNEAPFVPVENSLHQLQERETRDRERFSDVTSDDKNVLNLLTLQLWEHDDGVGRWESEKNVICNDVNVVMWE